MAPVIDQMVDLVKRADGCGTGNYRGYDGRCYRSSNWYWWGRWVFAGISILFVLLIFALLFRNSRRRRRAGQAPVYGTGWMAPGPAPPYGPPPPQYTPQDQTNNNIYPPPGGHKYNQNDGYYGNQPQRPDYASPYGSQYGQQEGIQLQQPQQSYHRGGDADYAPPPGPPPNAANKPF
ncbi:chitin synthesis regulation, resistance to congo red-domain-containing protein [Podospora australis]|uniref:Chitin synthesis regulation, resistance to congo red-domain-containing protein n=1 Tax=Podospora australis TaxID=1536484 RepID=A0AAN6X3Q8_9PEZI|nr:chitin synthesis regulation, resistance to congo red-domain-containing protein [Podospora australis]